MSSQLCLRMAGYLNYISSRYVFIASFVSLTKYAWQKLSDLMWLRMAGNLGLYILTGTIIWIMSCFLTAKNRPVFQWSVYTYVGRSHLYLLQLCIWLIFTMSLTSINAKHNHQFYQKYRFCLFIIFIYICLKSVHYRPKSKAIISHYLCDLLGLYFAYSCTW